MPFRLPNNYRNISVQGHDPAASEVEKYVQWLESELFAARAYLLADIVARSPEPIDLPTRRILSDTRRQWRRDKGIERSNQS